ncbi:expressed unknown protein [Seminavis robusta]|uniref:Uncharacterized protein n=1 Tax=Seminavis robusta TaxID=568900 RepID=A0A9N8EG15_9STRA|nr:expressed unknown protein [Seminavis robusta]|eukprot:Sro890_g216760.1 n/a (361) ;mRNA; r:32918-34000
MSTTSSACNKEQAGEGQRSFILSLLNDAMAHSDTSSATPLSFESNITLVSDTISHLPCRYSKTWRKSHGWSDLPSGSGHSDSRWKSAEFAHHACPQQQQATTAAKPAAVCPVPPSPPKRQSSCGSTDMAQILQVRRQSSNSSLGSSASAKKKKAFQYPPTLGQLPEEEPRSNFATTPMAMPQRQDSNKSFGSSQQAPSQPQPRNSNLSNNIPMSLFAAPSMPQRQESCSTLGSRQSSFSTLSTQDSFRSLNSGGLQSVKEDSAVVTKEFHIAPQDLPFGGTPVPPPPLDLLSSPGSLSSSTDASSFHSSSTTTASSSKKKFDMVYVPPTDPSRLQQNRRRRSNPQPQPFPVCSSSSVAVQ